MTPKQRFQQYQEDMCSVTETEFDSYTKDQWCDWCSSYELYVRQGGTRPPRRPPV